MFLAKKLNRGAGTSTPPATTDAQFNYVTMLLHGDGTNGAQNNTFVDSSSNNFTITRNGNTTQGSFSPYGSNWSNFFDGTGDYLSTANNSANLGTGDFNITFWINLTAAPSNGVPATNAYNGTSFTNGWYFYTGVGTDLSFGLGNATAAAAVTATVNLINEWHFIEVTRSSSTLSIYVDGVFATSKTNTNNGTVTGNNTKIGSRYDGTSGFITGYISNFKVVVGTAGNTANYTPPTAPATATTNTSLLTCQSNRFVDNSTNNFTITASGTPSVQRFNPFGASAAYSTSVIGGSAYFDGSGDNLSVAANSSNLGTGDFNITFWLYFPTEPLNGVPATNAYNATAFTNGWYFYTGVGTDISFGLGSAGGADAVSGSVNGINSWHYVEATRSGSTLSLYLDGVLAQSKSNTKTGTVSGNITRIGARYDGGGNAIAQYITDFKVVIGTAGNTSAYTPPTAPASATGSTLMLSMQNAAIFDNAMMNDLETVGNAQISTSVKKYGTGSMYFDGSGDWLIMPYGPTQNFGTGAFTIEMWAYLNSLAASYYVPAGTWGAGTSDEWLIQIQNNGSIRFLTTSGSTFYSASITTATWYHIAIVRSGSTVTIYVNGTSVGNYTCSNSLGSVSKTLYIGSQAGTWDWNGYIDDLRITKGYARYTANFTPPTAAFPNTGPI